MMNQLIPLTLCLGATCGFVQAAEADWAHSQSDIKPDPQITFGKLPNGLKYVIRPNAEPPGRMSIRLHVGAAALMESEEQRGLAHFIEHMVFNGSRHFKPGEMIPTMQRLGLGFGGDANAYTAFDETVYMLDIPNLAEETLKTSFHIMRDFADGANFPDKEIEKERGVIINELKLRDSIEFRQQEDSFKFLLNGTLLPERFPIGKEKIIKTAPREQFLKYYGDYYTPERMTVVLVGDITPQQGEELVKKYFGDMKPGKPVKNPEMGKLTDSGIKAGTSLNKEASRTSVTLSNVRPFVKKIDNSKQRAEDLSVGLAMDMLNLRLDLMSKQPDCPFNQAGGTHMDLFGAGVLTAIQATTSPDKWTDSLKIIENELRRAVQHGFNESELTEVKANILNQAEQAVKTWKTQQSKNLAKAIIDSISDDSVISSPEEDLKHLKVALETITPEKCQKALEERWDGDQAKIFISGNATIPDGEKAIIAEYNKARQIEVKAPEKQKVAVFAYDKIGEPGKIASEEKIQDLGIDQFVLSNGIRVNLKPTSFQENTILIDARIDGGKLALPKDKPGIDILAEAVMQLGGLEAHDETQLRRILAGKNVGLGFKITEDRFSVSGRTNPADFELQMKLLAASLLHPGFRQEGEILLKRQIPIIYSNLNKEASAVFRNKALSWIVGDDYRFSFPKQEELNARTTDEVKSWLAKPLKENAMEISIVGDFDPKVIREVLTKTIGAMPARAKSPLAPKDADITLKQVQGPTTKRFEYQTSLDKVISVVAWPMPDGKDTKMVRRLNILSEILGNRLQEKIREEMGDTYSPQCSLRSSEVLNNASMMLAISPGDRENTDRVCAAIRKVAQDMKTNGVTQDEFNRIMKPILADIKKTERDNAYWLSGVLNDSQVKQNRISRNRERLSDLNSITIQEISELAGKLLSEKKAITIQVVPSADSKIEQKKESSPGKSASLSQRAGVTFSLKSPFVIAAKTAKKKKTASEKTIKGAILPDYVVLASPDVMGNPEWKQVATTLGEKHNAKVLTWDKEKGISSVLPELQASHPRMMSVVDLPENIDRARVAELHRLTRKIDSDPYGDCIFGLISGYTAKDALKLVSQSKPFVISRAMGTTNINHDKFAQSFAITDWEANQTMEQIGGKEPQKVNHPKDDTGSVKFFEEKIKSIDPQLLVTSAHATQYNLEMPFGQGLIASMDNKFYVLKANQRNEFARFLTGSVFSGKEDGLANYLKKSQFPVLKLNDTPKVWLAAGNCLIGDAKNTKNSMVITALSSGGFEQLVGYTVPSWYGKSGWGTLSAFFDNSGETSLSEAWYLNNQSLIAETIEKFPKLMPLEMNCNGIEEIEKKEQAALGQMVEAGYDFNNRDVLGLYHDRDVVAFWGDPAQRVTLSQERQPAKWTIQPLTQKSQKLVITATKDSEGRFMNWFRTTIDPSKYVLEINGKIQEPGKDWILTNDFLIISNLKLAKGQTATLHLAK